MLLLIKRWNLLLYQIVYPALQIIRKHSFIISVPFIDAMDYTWPVIFQVAHLSACL